MTRAFITVGLGFGDEGKGATVECLCRKFGAGLVVKYTGGAQCAHNVIGPNGKRHPFSQFGAGTFQGVRTFLGPHFIVDPFAIINEASALKEAGLKLSREMLFIHPRALVVTPLHSLLNQLDKDNVANGTCGRGIGKAREYWIKHGDEAICAEDCTTYHRASFDRKAELFRNRIMDTMDVDWGVFEDVFQRTLSMKSILSDLDYVTVRMGTPLSKWNYNGAPVIFEGSQGLLLDQGFGKHPHTTWSDITPRHALALCKGAEDYIGVSFDDVTMIGVTRSYLTRHGNGPLPTENEDFPIKVDPGNGHDKWQGKMRFGAFDGPLFRYAVDICQLYGKLDYLAVNHLDEVEGGVMYKDLSGCGYSEIWKNYRPISQKMSVTEFYDMLSAVVPIGIAGYGPEFEKRTCTIK